MDMSFYGKSEEGTPLLPENVAISSSSRSSSETSQTDSSFSIGKILLLVLSLSVVTVALLSVFTHQSSVSSNTMAEMQTIRTQPEAVPQIINDIHEEADFRRRPYVPGSPTWRPKAPPTPRPSPEPTHRPTYEPQPSPEPTHRPSYEPTHEPSHAPSPDPTHEPSHRPTEHPSYSGGAVNHFCTFTFTKGKDFLGAPKGCVLFSVDDLMFLKDGQTSQSFYGCTRANEELHVDGHQLIGAGLIDNDKSLISTIIPGHSCWITFYSETDFTGYEDTWNSNYYERLTQWTYRGAAPGNDDIMSFKIKSETTGFELPSDCQNAYFELEAKI